MIIVIIVIVSSQAVHSIRNPHDQHHDPRHHHYHQHRIDYAFIDRKNAYQPFDDSSIIRVATISVPISISAVDDGRGWSALELVFILIGSTIEQ